MKNILIKPLITEKMTAESEPLAAAWSRLSKLSPAHRLISAAHACCCSAAVVYDAR